MSETTANQLDAIQAMLAAGHRSIRMPKFSLMLWGIAGGILCLATDHIITQERFPDHTQRAIALLLFLGIVLSGVAIADYHYTRFRVRAQDESLPFAQTQVTKVWWLLISAGVLFTFGTSFMGGGRMTFGIWIVLFGLGLYIHGLFSEQIVEWVGVLMILLGSGALVFNLPYPATQWLAASIFAVGMPVLTLLIDRSKNISVFVRVAQTVLWLAVVLVAALAANQWRNSAPFTLGTTLPLQQFTRQKEILPTQIVSLPAGTIIPLKVHVKSNVFADNADIVVPFTLSKPLEISLNHGKPDGLFRVADGPWRKRSTSFFIQVLELDGALTPSEGPVASMLIDIRTE